MKSLLVNIKTTAKVLGISEITVRRWVEQGLLRGCKIRGNLRVCLKSINEYGQKIDGAVLLIDPGFSNEPRLITIHSAAAAASVSTRCIRRLIQEGDLSALKIAGCLRLHSKNFEGFVEDRISVYQKENGTIHFLGQK